MTGRGASGVAPRILLVDDSPLMRSFWKRALTVCGYKVGEFREAGDGVAALAEIEKARPDLVVTDINMPRMNGEELLNSLRADARYRKLPVVVVSTDATEARVERLLGLGAAGYLKKPFEPEHLAQLLAEVLPEKPPEPVFRESAEDVLERMFFRALCEAPRRESPGEECAAAHVGFTGSLTGALYVAAPPELARELAASFLGDEDVSEEAVDAMMAELANMCCGSFLSRYDPQGSFQIAPPVVESRPDGGLTGWEALPLDEGPLYWRMEWGEQRTS